MESRTYIAAQKKGSGQYNCAQAVATTYADIAGVSEELAENINAAFATGLGTMEGTCGAILGAGTILGLLTKDKVEGRKCSKRLMEKFKERNGTTVCCELKTRDASGQFRRDCNLCVADAAEFLEEIIKEKGIDV